MKMLTKVSNESSKARHLMSVCTDSHTHTYIHIYTKTVSIFSSKEKKKKIEREEYETLLCSYSPSFATLYISRDRIKATLCRCKSPRFGRCCVRCLSIVCRG